MYIAMEIQSQSSFEDLNSRPITYKLTVVQRKLNVS